ncbi:MAG: hypothetical protein OEY14_10970, partial [Myxococcales bacterium]|nr:hypothetical protein [Myxococcales bacterium]
EFEAGILSGLERLAPQRLERFVEEEAARNGDEPANESPPLEALLRDGLALECEHWGRRLA